MTVAVPKGRTAVLFSIAFSAAVAAGCFIDAELIWQLSDLATGGMSGINIAALLLGSGEIARKTRNYFEV